MLTMDAQKLSLEYKFRNKKKHIYTFEVKRKCMFDLQKHWQRHWSSYLICIGLVIGWNWEYANILQIYCFKSALVRGQQSRVASEDYCSLFNINESREMVVFMRSTLIGSKILYIIVGITMWIVNSIVSLRSSNLIRETFARILLPLRIQ